MITTQTEGMTDSSEANASHVIETKGLVKVYGKREVVRGVDLSVAGGEIIGLLGPNGAGKTTTFYMIVGLVAATQGQVFINGDDVTSLPMYKRARLGIGYLPQEASIFRKLSVYQNVQAIVETLPIPRGQRRDFIMSHLEELGLAHLAKQKAYTLSGGERRRLEITRALVARPRFILLDEPFVGVDPINVSEVKEIVLGLKAKGIGVLITDHNVRETLSIVDRAYLIHEGKVLSEGTSDFLINDEKSRESYLGKDFAL